MGAAAASQDLAPLQADAMEDEAARPKLMHAQSNTIGKAGDEFGQLGSIQKVASQENRPLTAVSKVSNST